MFQKIRNRRFAIVYAFILTYILISFLIRFSLSLLSFNEIDFSVVNIIEIIFFGLMYDFGVAVFLILPLSAYLTIVHKRLIGSLLDKIVVYAILSITLIITFFSFLGEFPFWEEFNSRYNFISVDYLIYTYEVVENINQSYPLPFLLSIIVLLILSTLFLYNKLKITKKTFTDKIPFKVRIVHFLLLAIIGIFYIQYITNELCEINENTYNNELSKNGVFSFFAAYRSNELNFKQFYANIEEDKAFQIIRKELKQKNQQYLSEKPTEILRTVNSDSLELKPNIILICLESFDANFMTFFGNTNNLTPNLDQLASKSILYTNMYATGTRTVRGMEAITLSVPPTPGRSIVRRPTNYILYSIATVLKQKNYALNFFYGGDGYFDNMNSFFGSQGFNIIDRNRGNPLTDDIKTKRINISDEEVSFENAWGVCDEDIYNKLLKVSDENFKNGKTAFSFVMTTSNHKPYSFPENKINLPQGSRNAAVKYTDYALGKFIEDAQKKPWFKNTIFVVIADHCASSAGKWDITINKHHIPAIIYNLPNISGEKVAKLASQIDIMPTIYGYLNWNYKTALYGKDITQMAKSEERALIGNYRTVGMLKDSIFTDLNDRKQVNQYIWNNGTQTMSKTKKSNTNLKELTISYYQTATLRFKNDLMQEN